MYKKTYEYSHNANDISTHYDCRNTMIIIKGAYTNKVVVSGIKPSGLVNIFDDYMHPNGMVLNVKEFADGRTVTTKLNSGTSAGLVNAVPAAYHTENIIGIRLTSTAPFDVIRYDWRDNNA